MKYLIVFFYIKCDTDNYRPIEEALCAVRYAAMLSPEADVVVLTERGPYEEAFKNECSAVFSFERQSDLKNAMGFQRVSALAHLQEAYPTVPILSLDGDAFLVRNCAHVFDEMQPPAGLEHPPDFAKAECGALDTAKNQRSHCRIKRVIGEGQMFDIGGS